MTGKLLSVCSLVLVLALPGSARAGEVHLTIQNGRVTLSARDATLRQILLEWERVGGTRIVNRDRVPGALLTLEFADVPEGQALATLLRPIAGYVATQRIDAGGGASQYSRIILMPGAAAPWSSGPAVANQASAPPRMGVIQQGRPQVQRRVLPDGRVVTVMDDPQQAGDDPDDTGDDTFQPAGRAQGIMRPPFNAPPREQEGQPADEATLRDAPGAQTPSAGGTASPTVPVTIAVPGALPTAKPNQKPPPGPPKPPGT